MTPKSQNAFADVSRHILRILDEWGLSGKDIVFLLALPSNTRVRHLEKYREGTSLPESKETMERIEHIAGIADALRTSFPRNAHMGIVWMRTPHKRFQNQTPLEVLSSQGLIGLRSIRSELDCAFGWNETTSNN